MPLSEGGSRIASAGGSPHAGLVGQYCTSCHDDIEQTAGLTLDHLDVSAPDEEPETWEAVIRKVRTGMMPPAGEPRPSRIALDTFAADLEADLDAAAAQAPNPGAPAIHRLNRTEYANAIRDLLALEVDVETLLPADDAAEGFDNMADVLTVSPSLVEGYVSAAMKISRRAVGDMTMLPHRVVYRPPSGFSQDDHVEGLPLGTRGGILVTHNFPLDAEYEFTVGAAGGGRGGPGPRGGGESAGPPAPTLALNFDGEPVETRNPRRFRMRMPAGPVEIGAAAIERSRGGGVTDYYAASGRGGGVSQIMIEGPFDATGPGDTPSRRRIFSCYPSTPAEEAPCAREILARLATSAYRYPLAEEDAEIDFLMEFFDAGHAEGGFEAGVQRALAMMLVNPRFLFRAEEEPADLPPGAVYAISEFDLASRLSFFLWSSIPDEELLELAADDRLSDPEVLRAQVERMLDDPRSQALVENFAGQWLYLRKLDDVEPESPQWDGNLRASFRRETEMLFASIIEEDRSIVDLIDADYTYLDERLARHYGVDGVQGSYFRRVALDEDSPRRGVLGQGSVLTVTSAPNRTSPVVRGAWILENIMGAPPPQPPPGVESNLDDAEAAAASSLRERLELHRADSVCASCHSIMDPIGLSLENFDLIGGWRTMDVGEPIDATGVLVDGTPVAGPIELREAILERSESFVTTATEKLMTYALGRGVEYYDMPAVRGVVRDAAEDDYRFSDLIYGVVTSTPFQMRAKAGAGESMAAEAAPVNTLSTGSGD
jgi:hypothetical protein